MSRLFRLNKIHIEMNPEFGSLVRLEGIVVQRGDEGITYGGQQPNFVRVIPSKVEVLHAAPKAGDQIIYDGRLLTVSERDFWNSSYKTKEGVPVYATNGFTFPTDEQLRTLKQLELAVAKENVARLTAELSN
jgi:hypothetical protein